MTNLSSETRTVDATKNKIKQREARVGIIGLGYVGLPLALLFSDQKFPVTGFDIDQRKVDALLAGRIPIYEPGLEELVQRNLAKSATLDYWESGMDLGLSRDMFDSFLKYQTAMQMAFRQLQKSYGFTIVDGNRSVDFVTKELRRKIGALLEEP